MPNISLYNTEGTFVPDNLIANGSIDQTLKGITVLTGQGILKRGSVLGIITAGAKGKLVAKASVDGSQVAKYILADDIDNTAADHEDSLRQYGIFLSENIAY